MGKFGMYTIMSLGNFVSNFVFDKGSRVSVITCMYNV